MNRSDECHQPETVNDVFHFADTRSRSRKKNTADAISAMEMIQKKPDKVV
jgi:hypothetical protein